MRLYPFETDAESGEPVLGEPVDYQPVEWDVHTATHIHVGPAGQVGAVVTTTTRKDQTAYMVLDGHKGRVYEMIV